jgi:hypothetical protein
MKLDGSDVDVTSPSTSSSTEDTGRPLVLRFTPGLKPALTTKLSQQLCTSAGTSLFSNPIRHPLHMIALFTTRPPVSSASRFAGPRLTRAKQVISSASVQCASTVESRSSSVNGLTTTLDFVISHFEETSFEWGHQNSCDPTEHTVHVYLVKTLARKADFSQPYPRSPTTITTGASAQACQYSRKELLSSWTADHEHLLLKRPNVYAIFTRNPTVRPVTWKNQGSVKSPLTYRAVPHRLDRLTTAFSSCQPAHELDR